MVRHAWSVLCDRTIIDSTTGKVSLIDCVDQLWVLDESYASHGEKEGSGAETKLTIATLWFRSDGEEGEVLQTQVSIQPPSGKAVPASSLDPEVRFPRGILRTRVFTNVPVVPLRGPGHYQFLLRLKQPSGRWKTYARLPLLVNFGKPTVPTS